MLPSGRADLPVSLAERQLVPTDRSVEMRLTSSAVFARSEFACIGVYSRLNLNLAVQTTKHTQHTKRAGLSPDTPLFHQSLRVVLMFHGSNRRTPLLKDSS